MHTMLNDQHNSLKSKFKIIRKTTISMDAYLIKTIDHAHTTI